MGSVQNPANVYYRNKSMQSGDLFENTPHYHSYQVKRANFASNGFMVDEGVLWLFGIFSLKTILVDRRSIGSVQKQAFSKCDKPFY